MAVSAEEVRHVADLARLGLEPGRVAQLAHELNGILAHMDALSAVDARASDDDDGNASLGMPLRVDGDEARTAARLVPPAARERMAPWMQAGFFLVPRLSTHTDADDSPHAEGNGEGA